MPADPPHIHPSDQALDTVIDTLAARIPADRDTVAATVHRVYAELSATATVDTHLNAKPLKNSAHDSSRTATTDPDASSSAPPANNTSQAHRPPRRPERAFDRSCR